MPFRIKKIIALVFVFIPIFSFAQKKIVKNATKQVITKNKIKTNNLARLNYLIDQTNLILKNEHYKLKPIDDSFSKEIFTEYIKRLDYEKLLFTSSDIKLFKKYEYKLDDLWKTKNYTFLYHVDSIYALRIKENKHLADSLLSHSLNYMEDEYFNPNVDSIEFVNNYNEKANRWKSYIKFLLIDNYYSEIKTREHKTYKDSLTGKLMTKDTSFVIKADSTIEREVRSRISKNLSNRFKRFTERFTFLDKFNVFLNQVSEYFDPHTNYLAPADKREFYEAMSKHFYGIGAELTEDEEGIKINRVLAGSPAFKSQKLHAGDRILKVGQSLDTFIDIGGFEVVEAVRLIRGNDSTWVYLVIKRPTGQVETISILRKEIKTDEVLVKSAVIKTKDAKIGFLSIPDFYSDFSNSNEDGAKSYIDVATEIEKLKSENVSGIIIDLRNNGGGSLYDVVQIAGFFMFDGPIVQVKSKNGGTSVLNDGFKWILYSGPLEIMVNEYSASASEILAAALQDYKRGVIIGSPSTYGKGTVQKTTTIELPKKWTDTTITDLGVLKITIQKFYRINGNSTQRLGVVPDIIIPDKLQYAKLREQDNPTSMPYDQIAKTDYKEWMYNSYDLNAVKEHAQKRISENPVFNLIDKNAQWLADVQKSVKSLKLDKHKVEQDMISLKNEEIDSAYAKIKGDTLNVDLMQVDIKKFTDEDKNVRNLEWAHSLRKDVYLKEAVNVMTEMIDHKPVISTATVSTK